MGKNIERRKLTIANDMFRKGNVNLVFSSKYLDVLGDIGAEVADGPGTEDRVLVGRRPVVVVARRQYKTGFRRLHPGPN